MHPSVYLLATLFIEVFSLYYFSRQLTKSLSQLIYRLTHSQNWTIRWIAIIFLPGTFIHEMAHALVAGVLFVDIGEIELMPEIQEHGVKLGSVEIAKTDALRRAIIGVAPVFVGLLLIVGSLFALTYYYSQGGAVPWWGIALFIYLLFVVGNTMFSSHKDLEGAVEILIVILIAVIALYVFLVNHFPGTQDLIFNPLTNEIITRANISLLVLICSDIALIALFKAFLRR